MTDTPQIMLAGALLVVTCSGCEREQPLRHQPVEEGPLVTAAEQLVRKLDPKYEEEDPLVTAANKLIKKLDPSYVDDIPGLQRLCDGGDRYECGRLVDKLLKAKRFAEAVPLLHMLCDAKDARLCDELGYIYMEGRVGVKRQPSKALALYRKLYREGEWLYWDRLAWFYDEGIVVRKDLKRGWQIHLEACARRNNVSCWVLGTAYREGTRVKADRARAYDYFRQACKVPPNGVGCKEEAELRPAAPGR